MFVEEETRFSAALCRGLIEARSPRHGAGPPRRFPRLYAAASLKLRRVIERLNDHGRFPRLYAAASLKHGGPPAGLGAPSSFPRLYAAASLKPGRVGHDAGDRDAVFRGFMPRPH